MYTHTTHTRAGLVGVMRCCACQLCACIILVFQISRRNLARGGFSSVRISDFGILDSRFIGRPAVHRTAADMRISNFGILYA